MLLSPVGIIDEKTNCGSKFYSFIIPGYLSQISAGGLLLLLFHNFDRLSLTSWAPPVGPC